MPIYEYVCTHCDHELEVLQKMSDLPLEECPACGHDALKKKISAAGFRLKGTGWYETDFKGKKKISERTEETPSKKTDSTPSDKTDSSTSKETDASKSTRQETHQETKATSSTAAAGSV